MVEVGVGCVEIGMSSLHCSPCDDMRVIEMGHMCRDGGWLKLVGLSHTTSQKWYTGITDTGLNQTSDASDLAE